MRRLSAQQAPSANALRWLYMQCAGSDGLTPLPDGFAAPQSLHVHTRTEPQQAAMTMRHVDMHFAALKHPAQMRRITCTHGVRPHLSDTLSV